MTSPPYGPNGPHGTEPIPTFTYDPGKQRRPMGLIIGAVVGVLVLVGGALFFVMRGGSTPTPTPGPIPGGAAAAAPGAITVQGDQIMRDGQPWWFLGYNSFVWSGDCGED